MSAEKRFQRLYVVRAAPPPWSAMERLVFWAAVFFATVAVGMWAATLWDGGFAMGLGWAIVLYLAALVDRAHGG